MANPSTIVPLKRFNNLLIGEGIIPAMVKWMQQNDTITQLFPDISILPSYHENYQTTFPACIMVYPSRIGDMDKRFWRGTFLIHVKLSQGNMFETRSNLLNDAASILLMSFRLNSQFIYDLRTDVPGLAYLSFKMQTDRMEIVKIKKPKDLVEFVIEVPYAIRIREYERYIARQHAASAAVLQNDQYQIMERNDIISADANGEVIRKRFDNI